MSTIFPIYLFLRLYQLKLQELIFTSNALQPGREVHLAAHCLRLSLAALTPLHESPLKQTIVWTIPEWGQIPKSPAPDAILDYPN